MLGELTFSRSRFTLKVTRPIILSKFVGFTLRGAFGTMLRQVICAQRHQKNCKECYLKNSCAYAVIFTPTNQPGSKYFPGNEQLPHSFIFHIKEDKAAFATGEEFNLVLTLVGKIADYFPYFFIVLQELGKEGFGLKNEKDTRGSFRIEKITDELAPESKAIFNGTTKVDMPPLYKEKLKNLLSFEDISLLKIHFITPLRVKWQGRLCSDIQFHILFRNVLRRLSALYFLSENKLLELDYHLLIKQAEEIDTLQANFNWNEYFRYSGRQKERMKLGGVTGQAVYKGDLSRFYPFLQAAELMAVGKGTTFGFGRIALETMKKGGQ